MNPEILLNLKKMIGVRKYKIIEEYKNNKMILQNQDKQVIVLFIQEEKIKIDIIKKIINDDTCNFFDHYIFITHDKITTKAKKEFINFTTDNNSNKEFEIFKYNNFYNDILSHELQPKYRLLDKNEIKIILSMYGMKLSKCIPSDAFVKYFNAKPGDIFEIKRKDGSIVYRYVTKIEK